ncbi:MAG TPA: DUF305 domain-containing protein [Anaerolineales bacterium]|jgi:hypothetical protein
MEVSKRSPDPGHRPYRRLAIALLLSYLVMGAVMFSRVDAIDNLFVSLNQVYMAGLMVAPMLIIMLVVMGPMYPNRSINLALVVTGLAAIGLWWGLLRNQVGVGDQQFLHAMIPHHAAAILVCEQASLTNPEIIQLCQEIVETQEREIAEMKTLMN